MSVFLCDADSCRGESLLAVLRRLGFFIDSGCAACGRCGRCRVSVAPLCAPDKFESVLACAAVVDRDLIVRVPDPPRAGAGEDEFRVAVERCASPRGGGRFAAAVDLGTTTLAAALIDIDTGKVLAHAGCRNPQRRFGADLLSRLQMAGTPQGLSLLRRTLLDAVGALLAGLAAQLPPKGAMERVAAAGNSVMSLIFHGLDPSPMGHLPFDPPVYEFPPLTAGDLAWPLPQKTPVVTLPLLSRFVGGDLTAGLLLLRQKGALDSSGPVLLMDLGTNGEIILAHNGRFLAASTAAGPVFEGGHIRCGSMAVPGAVDRVDFTARPPFHTIGDCPPIGLCGSGVFDIVAELLRVGVLLPSGRFVSPSADLPLPRLARLETLHGQRAFFLGDSSAGQGDIVVTQGDIRQFQLAVGAMKAGVEILLQRAGIQVGDLAGLYVAGALGAHLSCASARRVGLFPEALADERLNYLGNSSLEGAALAARFPELGKTASELRRATETVDLAGDPDFEARFVRSMRF